MSSKKLTQSRTVLFATIMGAVNAALGYMGAIQAFVDPEVYGYLYMTLGIVNAIGATYLRSITNVPISK